MSPLQTNIFLISPSLVLYVTGIFLLIYLELNTGKKKEETLARKLTVDSFVFSTFTTTLLPEFRSNFLQSLTHVCVRPGVEVIKLSARSTKIMLHIKCNNLIA